MDKPFQDFIDSQLGACGFVLLDNAMIRRQRPIFFSTTLAPKISQSKRFYREAVAILEQHAKPVLLTLHGGRVIPAMCLCPTEVDMMVWQLTGETVLSVEEVSLQDLLAVIDNPAAIPQPETTQRQNDYWTKREQEIKAEGLLRDLELEAEMAEHGTSRLYDDDPDPSALRHITRILGIPMKKQKPLYIELPAEQHRAIKIKAAQAGTSVAKLVRSELARAFAFQAPAEPQRQQKGVSQ